LHVLARKKLKAVARPVAMLMAMTTRSHSTMIALALVAALAATPRRAPLTLAGLVASGPAPDIAQKMMLFGRLVGSWDIDYTAYPTNADSIVAKCEWHFAWVLDGRAVQDVWICPPRATRGHTVSGNGEWGTTIRVYDKKADLWHVVFIGPVKGNVNQLEARPWGTAGADILQEARDSTGTSFRWNFDRITPTSFHWWSEMSSDGGRTWVRQEQMIARRHS
jgi:hypothetical protein